MWGADGNVAGLEYLLGLLPGELDVVSHISPERGADIHQLGAVMTTLRHPLPEGLQVLPDLLEKQLPVCGGGPPGVPLRFTVADPNMRGYAAAEIWISGDRLLFPNVLESQQQCIHLTLCAVQHLYFQCVIVVGHPGGDEL